MFDLHESARSLFIDGKGILAADESTHSADKRLTEYKIKTGPAMRQKYRNLFLGTEGVEQYLSGVILHSETLAQQSDAGVPFAKYLEDRGIMPGIKVDEGTEPAPESPDELITGGLLGLSERLVDFKTKYNTGFTKWRAVVRIDGERLPTCYGMVENAKRLAVYALEAQVAGMVPMVEPEVLYAGTHSRLKSREVITETLKCVVEALKVHGVDLSATIIKTSMALSGSESGRTDTPQEVAEDTLAALMEAVPKQIAGIVFLSGGQTPDQVTANLAAIMKLAKAQDAPWPLTFSFARALQEEALTVWEGKEENVPAARAVFRERLVKVSRALSGI